MLRILLARHGQTEWNLLGKNQGHAEVPLDETGRLQADQLCDCLSKESPDAIYCSDLTRTIDSMRKLSNVTGITIITDPRLRERNYGNWEGMTFSEVKAQYPDHEALYHTNPALYAPPGGETGIELFARTANFLFELLQTHKSGTIVVCSHGGTIASLIAGLLLGSPATASCIRIKNASITEIHILCNGRRRLIRFDDTSHLNPAPLDPHRPQAVSL